MTSSFDDYAGKAGSSVQNSKKVFPKIDILKELSQDEELKSSPRLRLLKEDDIISDKAAESRNSPVPTISSRTPSPSLMAKRLSVNASRMSKKRDIQKMSLLRQGSVDNSLRSNELTPSPNKSPNDKRKGFFRKQSGTLRHVASGSKRVAKLRASSTKEFPEESFDNTDEVYDIQHLFHHYDSPIMRKRTLQRRHQNQGENSGEATMKSSSHGLSHIQEVYYNTLRRRMGKRRSQKLEEPAEFSEQIKEIKDSIRTPNEMRSRDILITDKTKMERILKHQDDYPLLEFRRKVLKFLQLISIFCNKIIQHPLFDYLILCVVAANSILLALDNPTDDKPAVPTGVDNALLAIYTIEMVLKILGMGFVLEKKSYLRDYWNIMDFIIVVTAYVPIVFSSSSVNLQAFRALRVLRPLRTISNIKALKVIVLTLLSALGPLLETVFILVFMYIIFAIAGLQLFSGLLKKRCIAAESGIATVDPSGDEDINFTTFCNLDSDCPDLGGKLHLCAKMIANPLGGIVNFDTLPSALLMVFQIVSTEGWSGIMYDVQKTFSSLTAVYFMAIIVMCTFFLLNLTLAIIKAEFTSKSTDENKGKVDRRFLSYDFKLAEKLEENKIDVLRLIRRREKGEIRFDKYLFQKDNLVALQATNAKRTRRRKQGTLDKIKQRFTQVGSALGNKIKFRERAKKGFLTVVTAMRLFRLMRTSSKSSTIHPSPEEKNLMALSNNSIPYTTPTPMPSKLKSAEKNSQFQTNSFFGQKTEEMSFQSKDAKEDQYNSPQLRLDENDALKSPAKPDGFSLSPNENKSREEVSFEGIKANSFIAGIAEANEQSEQSINTPTEVSAQSLSDAKLARRRTMGLKTSTTPIRPIISQKIQVTPLEQSGGKRALIGMAGIRNKEEKKVKFEKLGSGLDLLSLAEKSERNEISMSEDRSFLEHPDHKHSYIFPSNPKKGNQNEDEISKNMLRKINQIKKLGNKINKSMASSNRKKNELLPSIFDLEEEVMNYRQKEIEANIPSGILDDSDFFNDKQRYEMLRHKKANKQYKRKLTNRSPGRAFSNAEMFSPMARRRIHDLEEAEGLLSPDEKGSPEFPGTPAQVDRIDYESEEEEDGERYVIDVRYLKPDAAFEKEYETVSMDDVLPSEKERLMNQKEQEVQRQLRETRLPMKFRITQFDQDRAQEQTTARYTKSKFATSLAFQHNLTVQKVRKHKLDLRTFEENLEKKTSGIGSFARSGSKTTLARSSTRHTGGMKRKLLANALRWNPGAEEDYLPPGKENDFFEVLKMINKPFKNEGEIEEPEENKKKMKEFMFNEDYKNYRKKDLKSNNIAHNNWSGLTVLGSSGRSFAIERVKMALNNQDFDVWRKGILGLFHAFRRRVLAFIQTSFFNNIILLAVFLNTIILASQNLITSTSGQDVLTTCNLIFTIIFTIEMGLKIIALGPIGYGRDPMNLFDFLIVVLSLFDQISTAQSGGSSSGGAGKKAVSAFRTVRLFRTFRVLRVTKLLRTLAYMKIIIGVISRSVKKFIFILMLLFLFIFIYSLLGMQLFGGKYVVSDTTTQEGLRENYNSFFNAFLCVFQIMTQENWNDFMTISILSKDINTYVSLLYLISWMCIGNYIFLNLFLAILLDEFTGEETEEELEELEEENEEDEDSLGGRTSSKTTVGFGSTRKGTQKTMSKDSLRPQSFDSKVDLDLSEDEEKSEKKVREKQHTVIACRRSLYIFTKRNPIRAASLWIIRHRYFETLILIMIGVSSVKLALDTFIPTSATTLSDLSGYFDKVVNIFFLLEAVVKIISLGFFMDEGSYTRDSWNNLDLVIVITSMIDMTSNNVNIPAIKVLRLLRTLRPLRVVSHNPSMRLIVTALLESLKPMLNVLIVICLIWLMFAILAVNIIGNKLGRCQMTDTDASYYGVSEASCASVGTWTTPNVNFDNVFNGMLSLFILSTMENWPAIMFTVADAGDADTGPSKDGNQLFAGIFFVVFLLIGSFFLINLFVGVIFLEFTRAEKRENQMQKFLTPNQQQWVIMQRLITTQKADLSNVEPEAEWMKKIFRIINHGYFEGGIMVVILLNILSMCLTYDGCSDGWTNMLQYINYVFSAVFFAELVLKHLGLGFRRYWSSGWNRFDAFVVFASILDLVMDFLQQSFLSFLKVGPQIARIFRVLRVTRLFKLVKQFEGLQKLINTLIFSLPSLLNVGALLFLVFYIYAVLGTFLFKNIATGAAIGDLVNFSNAALSFLTLFRCSTGENWYIIMFDTVYPTSCVDGVTSCSTSLAVVLPFWLSFIVIAEYIFLNLFILVILQQFEEYHLNPDNPVNKFREAMEDKFIPTWEKFSLKHGGAHIHENQLLSFFMTMQGPVGYKNSTLTKKEMAKEVMRINIVQDQYRMLFYNDVIYSAFKHGFNSEAISDFEQYQYLLKEEIKNRKKLDNLRKIAVFHKARNAVLQKKTSVKPNGANPIEKILFMGMTMKAWIKYTTLTYAKMQAAEENGVEYIYSDSDEEEAERSESEFSDSYDDMSPEDGGRHFDFHQSPVNDLIEEEQEGDSSRDSIGAESIANKDLTPRGGRGNRKVSRETTSGVDEDKHILSHLQAELGSGNINSHNNLSLAPHQKMTRHSLSPFIEKKDPPRFTGERNRSLSTLTPPKIFMHSAEGEIHDLTPKVSARGHHEKPSFGGSEGADSKNFIKESDNSQ